MTENKNVRIIAANLHNFVHNPLMEVLSQTANFKEVIGIYKEGRKALTVFQDAQNYINLGIGTLAGIWQAYKQIMEAILNTFDISYHQLMIAPQVGGLNSYVNTFQMHLFDKSDDNRPNDKGAAVYFTVMFLFSFKDLAEANRRAQQLKDLFTAFQGQRADILKAQVGYTDFDQVKQEFWGHYQKKYLAGSRAQQTPNSWIKHSVADIIGVSQAANVLTNYMNQISRVPDSAAFNLSDRIDKVFDQIIGVLDDITLVVDAYVKLLLDTQITVLLLPPITGSVSNIIPYIVPAYQNLGHYATTIGDQIDTKTYVDLAPNGQNPDYSSILRSDFYTTGLNMVFKGPDATTAIGEARAVMALWGITVPDIPLVAEAFEAGATPYGS